MTRQEDKWAREIAETYLRVLTRPNHRTHIVEPLVWVQGPICHLHRAVIERDVNRYVMTVKSNKHSVALFVSPLDEDGDLDWDGKFKYRKVFSRSAPDKVRKSALVLVKKLSMRTVMDIMNC
jgi:hypothetical protein